MLVACSVQPADGLKPPPLAGAEKLAVPVGVIFVGLSVSVTVAVQLVAFDRPTGVGAQATVVALARLSTDTALAAPSFRLATSRTRSVGLPARPNTIPLNTWRPPSEAVNV
jgi:hypothetical protein